MLWVLLMGAPQLYASTYCNAGHRLDTGRPVGHECRTIPPAVLELERADRIPEALELWRRIAAGARCTCPMDCACRRRPGPPCGCQEHGHELAGRPCPECGGPTVAADPERDEERGDYCEPCGLAHDEHGRRLL